MANPSMILYVLLAIQSLGGEISDDEEVRFEQVESAPEAEASEPWSGGLRAEVTSLNGVESRIRTLGARPEDTVMVSAQLDWGRIDRNSTSLRFTGAGMTVRARRLSDGQLLHQGTVVDETGSYDLSDPKERDRLCTRARAGELEALELHTFAATQEAGSDPSFLVVDGTARTALIDLQPGESATVVEVVAPERRRPMRVRRSLTVERGDKVMTLTEGDVLQRVCVEF